MSTSASRTPRWWDFLLKGQFFSFFMFLFAAAFFAHAWRKRGEELNSKRMNESRAEARGSLSLFPSTMILRFFPPMAPLAPCAV